MRLKQQRWQSLLYILLVSTFLHGCTDTNSNALQAGEPFPTFSVLDLSGQKVTVPSQYTAKTRLISIRTIGCRFCESDFAELEKLYQYYDRDELDIFVINVGFEKKSVEEFLKDKTISFDVLIDEAMAAMKLTRNTLLPVVYLIDSDNTILARIQGSCSLEEIRHEMTTRYN